MSPPKSTVLEGAHLAAKVQEHDEALKGGAHNQGLLKEVSDLREWRNSVMASYRTIATVATVVFALGTAGVFTKLSQVQAAVETMTARVAAH